MNMASLLNTEKSTPLPDALEQREPVPEKKQKKQQLSRALAQIAKRALEVDPSEVDRFMPRELDVQIAESFLAGYVTYTGIAKMVGCPDSSVRTALKNPITCAWISRTVHRNISHRLGLVDAAMLQRAMCGDVRAADLLYKRYGQIANLNLTLHSRMGNTDFSKMTDEDLDAIVLAARKEDERKRIIDVEIVEKPATKEADL